MNDQNRMAGEACLVRDYGLPARPGGAIAPAAGAQTPKRGGTLTYMIPADAPPSFDGHRETTFATVHAAAPFYSVLIRVPPDNPASTTEFVCDLCTEMPKPTDDGKTYTFKIRKDVKFHDGSQAHGAGRGDELAAHRLPAQGRHQRARQLLRHGRQDRGARRRDRGLQAEVRDDGLPAGARRSLHLDLQEGDPREGSALVREEHHGLRPVQVRQPTRSASRSRACATRTTITRASPTSTARGHLRRQAVGPRRRHPRRPRRHRVPRPAAVGARLSWSRRPARTSSSRTSDWNCGNIITPNHKKKPFDDVRVRRALALADRPVEGRAGALQDRQRPARWAASSSRARRWRRPRRSCRRSPATGPTSRSRGPRRGGS